ncbi:hypothetical protein EVAR_96088_1 [Eumeta japonica]|uniref:Histone-lysine N-methyltransferase SETMAR n=1 Tax=Eumeta variegata TaxID=151549 RepID=A0A4C1VEZ5_EUMVA|nr:hypothetical protein EVAR_96088_1 [Eumeta japonica]
MGYTKLERLRMNSYNSHRHTKNLDQAKDKHEPRSSRPVTDKVGAILEKVEQDRHISSYDIAEELRSDHKTVLTNSKKAGYMKGTQMSNLDLTPAH